MTTRRTFLGCLAVLPFVGFPIKRLAAVAMDATFTPVGFGDQPPLRVEVLTSGEVRGWFGDVPAVVSKTLAGRTMLSHDGHYKAEAQLIISEGEIQLYMYATLRPHGRLIGFGENTFKNWQPCPIEAAVERHRADNERLEAVGYFDDFLDYSSQSLDFPVV